MGTQALVRAEPAGPSEWLPAMTIEQAVGRYRQMVAFVKQALEEGTDYGRIPGTAGKPTLLKPGAEKLCTFFGLRKVPSVLEKEEDWTGERHGGEAFFYYSYRMSLYRGDILIAAGDGSCNSWEKKYRWRLAERVCPECGRAAIIKGKEEYGGGWLCWKKKDGCGRNFAADDPAIAGQQVGRVPNADPADLVNTIQKMAFKRALVAATLLATNASDYFSQDLEDQLPDEHGEVIEGAPVRAAQQPQRPAGPAPPKANGPRLPANGLELRARLGDYDARLAAGKVSKPGELLSHVARAGTDQGWSDDLATWDDPEQIQFAADETRRFEAAKRRPANDHAQPAPDDPSERDPDGVRLYNRVRELSVRAHCDGLCTNDDDLLTFVREGGEQAGFPSEMVKWRGDQIRQGWEAAKKWDKERRQKQAAPAG